MEGLTERTMKRILTGYIIFLFGMFHEKIFLFQVKSYYQNFWISLFIRMKNLTTDMLIYNLLFSDS